MSTHAPPHDLEAERWVLGSIQFDCGLIADLSNDLFYLDRHRLIFEALLRLADADKPLNDPALLAVELERSGTLEAVGRAPYIAELLGSVPHAAHGPHYVAILREYAERRRLIEDAEERIRLARDPQWTPPSAADSGQTGPVLTCLADVAPRTVSWLWPGRIPLGRITLLVGRPGEGKSFLTTDMAARVTTGTPWPDGGACPRGSVLLISAEDDPADTVRPRLDAHYADVQRIHLLSAVRRTDKRGPYERVVTLADLDAIEAALKRLADCRLMVVDPVGSFLGGGTDSHRDNEVRGVLAPIAALAEKHGPAVLVVAHRRKSAGSVADDTALGSRAFTGIARAVWHLSRDPERKARRLLLPGKNNLACEGHGLAFQIAGDQPHVEWEREPIAMSADDALAVENEGRDRKPGPDAGAQGSAAAWLRTTLAIGARPAKELLDEWCNGHGGSKRTLERAKQSIGVEAYRPEIPGAWWWRLPNENARRIEDVEVGDLDDVAKTQAVFPNSTADQPKDAKLRDLGVLRLPDDQQPAPVASEDRWWE